MRSYLLSIARRWALFPIAALFLATTGAQAAWVIEDGGVLHGVSETTRLVCYSGDNDSNIVRISLNKDGSIRYGRAYDGSVWRFSREQVNWYETRIFTEKYPFRSRQGDEWEIQLSLDRIDGTLTTEIYRSGASRAFYTKVYVCGKTEIRRKF